jgi:small GTP-binding protein
MEYFNPADIAERILEALDKERQEMKTMNVMLLGKTGVGKSTLINNLFNKRLAETGIGRPVTQEIRQYSKENYPLTIYDTPGLELGGDNAIEQLLKGVNAEIRKGINSGKMEKAIHCILYCVSATSHRFEEEEKKFIRMFLDENRDTNIPVIIVITQSISKKDAKELQSSIEAENLNVTQIVPVLAEDYELDEDTVIKAYGLDRLSELMYEIIPDAMKKTFISVQKASIRLKSGKAHAVVAAAAAAAGATGAIPIPFADSFALVPEQIAMLASITAIFDLSLEKSAIAAITTATLGTAGATIAGKTAASGLLKLIPGAGSVAGGVISGSVAAALTAALGEAYIGIMIRIAKGEMSVKDLSTDEGKRFMSESFKNALRLRRNNQGERLDKDKYKNGEE